MNKPPPERQLNIQIWSDIACPWCYVGKRRLEAALARFEHRDAVNITWRAFELDRSAPKVYPPTPTYTERLANKYRIPAAKAQQMIDQMAARGAQEGITFEFPRITTGNTFGGHQVTTFANHSDATSEVKDALAEGLFKAYFTDGECLSNIDTLVNVGVTAGLPEAELRAALDCDTHAPETRREQAEAANLGITGVPFFLIGRYAVEGAQAPETLLQVLNRAWDELPIALPAKADSDEATVCTADGCI